MTVDPADAAIEPTIREHTQQMIASQDDLIQQTARNYAMLKQHGLKGPAVKALKALTHLHEGRLALLDVQGDPFMMLVGDMRIAIGAPADTGGIDEPSEHENNVISFAAWRAKEERELEAPDGAPDDPELG